MNRISKALIFLASTTFSKAQEGPATIQSVYEVFSLPKTEATELQRAGHNDVEFYKVVVDAASKKKAKQEKLLAIRTLPGRKAMTSQFSEFIAPTEYEPPELPNQVGLFYQVPGTATEDNKGGASEPVPTEQKNLFPVTPATPTSFETYLLGSELEIEPTLDESGTTISIRVGADRRSLLDIITWGQSLSELQFPKVTSNRQTFSLNVKSGVPTLLGTVSPAPDAQNKEAGERVWFAFLTSTVIKSTK